MGIKMTVNKRESEDAGIREHRSFEQSIRDLKGKDKLLYERGMIVGRIKNVEWDLSKSSFRGSVVITHKLNLLKENLKRCEEEIKKCAE